MRIIVVVPYYRPAYVYGGPVRSISRLAESLATLGNEVSVCSTDANGGKSIDNSLDERHDIAGVGVFYCRRSPLSPAHYFWSAGMASRLRGLLGSADIAYIAGMWTYPGLVGPLLARRLGVPYIVSPRGSLMNWSMNQRGLKKRIYLRAIERAAINGAQAIHCTCGAEVTQLKSWGFSPQVVNIPNPIDVQEWKNPQLLGVLRRRVGIPELAPVTIFVGRLHQMKRIVTTVQAFARVARLVADSHLVIAGEGGDCEMATKMYVSEAGLQGRVHFLGLMSGDAMREVYADADLLILLSHRENFGMVVAEAAAAKVPSLLSPGVGLATDVTAAGAGWVIDPEKDDIAERWASILSDRQGLRRAGEAASAWASRDLDHLRVAQHMSAAFDWSIKEFNSARMTTRPRDGGGRLR
jgi:glycosyltransferase involved in cell wall biosynthesis